MIDILEAGFLNYFGCSPNTERLLQNEWKAFHKNNSDKPHAKLLQICHSQGAIDVKNALQNSPPEIRDRIIVLAIAPAAIVPKRLCFESKNYASEKDIVYKFEPTRTSSIPLRVDSIAVPSLGETIDDRGELIILKAHPDAKWIDHEFQSPTFRNLIRDILREYEKSQGEYLPKEILSG